MLFKKEDCIKEILVCKSDNVKISGIEHFYVYEDETVMPNMQGILDCGSSARGCDYDVAISFVNSFEDGLFEIVSSK